MLRDIRTIAKEQFQNWYLVLGVANFEMKGMYQKN